MIGRSLVDELSEDREQDEKIIKSFYAKDSLSQDIFQGTKMIESVRDRLLSITDNFIDFLGVDFFIHDVVLTGSLANYNWSEFSDIDLHVIVDYDESGHKQDLLKEFFDAKRAVWNSSHDIKIKNYEVELYVQDVKEKHISSGVYSILNNKWIIEPQKEKKEIDDRKILEKGEEYAKLIDKLTKKGGDVDDVRKKLKRFRQTGLEDGGEYSYENLTFKLLRRNGYIEKLMNLRKNMKDKEYSINEFEEFINGEEDIAESIQFSIPPEEINKILNGYIEAALWTEEERLNDEAGKMNDNLDSGWNDESNESEDEIRFMKIMRDNYSKKSFDSFSREHIDPNSLIKAYTDIKQFLKLAGDSVNEAIEENGYERLGMDIWLTRNGHGAGFFDHSYDPENEKRLMDAGKLLGEVYLYINDNMRLSFSNEHLFENLLRESVEFNYKDILRVEKEAIKFYGTSDSFNQAVGFITPNGYLLDFGEGTGQRGMDHRNIGYMFDLLPDIDIGEYGGDKWKNSVSWGLYAVMDMGFIRYLPESKGIDMYQMPTQEQFERIRQLIQLYNGKIIVEMSKEAYIEYEDDTPEDYIIDGIKTYYREGIKPKLYNDVEDEEMFLDRES
jgi:hypothetical protein